MILEFKSYEEAVEFMNKINSIYNETGVVSYSDVLWILGCKPSEQDGFRGWRDILLFRVGSPSQHDGSCFFYTTDPIDLIEGVTLEPASDNVNHPNHYKTKNGLETIDVIEAFTEGLEGIEATDTGNILKYICRWKKKNGLEDLKKAQWYLNHLINHVEKEN